MSPTEDGNSHHSGTSGFQSEHRRFRRQYNPDDIEISQLFIAIRKRDMKKIKKLISKVKNINDVDRNDNDNTPLHVAVKKRYKDAVELLLKEKKVDVNAKNEHGDTSLHLAVAAGDKELVDVLIRKGCDVSLENNMEETPIDVAERMQMTDIVDTLKRHISSSQLTIVLKSKHDIVKKMSEYVKGFVAIYTAYLDTHHDILERKLQKQGKWSEFIDKITGQLWGGLEAIGKPYAKASYMVGLGVVQAAVSSTSTWLNRNQLKKLIHQLIQRKKDPKEMNKILISAAMDIFESYEAQFVQTTADNSWERSISKFVDDGVGRALNYFKANPDLELTVFNVKKGIVLGTSKTYRNTFFSAPKWNGGHTVKNKYLISWNTADVYEKTGVVVKTHGAQDEYYTKFEDSKIFGHRLVLDVDNLNVFIRDETPTTEPYHYVLNLDKSEKERLQLKLLKEIEEDNGYVAEMLRESLATIREEARKDVNQLEDTIAEHFKELMSYVSVHHEELRGTLQGLTEQLEREHSEVVHKLNELLSNTAQIKHMISQEPKQPVKEVFFDLRDPPKSFSGRSTQLMDMHKILRDPKYKILVISGLRGVGKTALVLKYLGDFSDTFDNNVMCINAQNRDILLKSVFELAQRLKLRTMEQDYRKENLRLMMREINEHFTKSGSKCVFVFDNADSYEIVKDVFPMKYPSGVIEPKIIITSTKSNWKSRSDHIKVYPLKDFEKTESEEFIKAALNLKTDDSQDDDIKTLADILSNFPLTLREATSYIIKENKNPTDPSSNRQYTVADYIKDYNTRPKELLSSNILQKYEEDYDKNTYTALSMSLNPIKSDEISAQTLEILNILAYFSSDSVPSNIFWNLADTNQRRSIEELLKDYSIAEVDRNLIAVHGLIRQVLKIDLEVDSENEKRILRQALNILKEIMGDRETAKKYTSHIVSVWNYASKYDGLIEEFIVNDLNVERKFLHFIVEGSDNQIFEKIISEITKSCLEKLEIISNVQDKDSGISLHLAAKNNRYQIVKKRELLINDGVASNVETTQMRFSPSNFAVENDERKLTKDVARDEETSAYIARHDHGPSNHHTYKSKITSHIRDELNETMLLMVYFSMVPKRKKASDVWQFYLASNHFDAVIIDDVPVKHIYRDHNARFMFRNSSIEAEQEDDPNKPRDNFTFTRLFTYVDGNQAFSLKDYFSTYLTIKRRESRALGVPVFHNLLDDREFVIYTNALAHRSFGENQKNVEKVPIESDYFLNLGATQHYYRLKFGDNEETKREIIDELRVVTDSVKLSRVLIKSIFQNKPPEISNLDIVKKYHVALSKKVIARTKGNTGKFFDSFVDGELSDGERIFRNTFFEEMRRLTEFSNMPEEDLKFALRNKVVKLSDNFGKAEQFPAPGLPTDFVDAAVVEGFFRQLKLFVGQVSESDLSEIIKQKMGQEYKMERSDIDRVFQALKNKVRNWWKMNNEYITDRKMFLQESAKISYRFDVREHVGLFTGRCRKLQELHAALREEGKVVVVWGSEGVGKTELVRRHISISNHNKDYGGNFIWINAENYNTLAESFTRLANEHLDIDTKDEKGKPHDIKIIVREVFKFFSKRKSLFIFDNAARLASYEEHDGGVDRFLPEGPNKPRIIITSRNRDWGNLEKINLNVFEEDEAWEYIESAVTKKVYREDEAKILASELQYFPLALAVATAYIRIQNEESKQFTIKDYIEKYQTKAKEPFNVKLDHDHSDTLFNTWAITVERIKDETCGDDALKILDSVAYFAPNNIPLDLALNLIDGDKPERKLRTATRLLDQYSMVHRDSGLLNVHRLIQQVTRIYLDEQKRERDVLDSALKAVTKNFDDKTDTSHAITAWEASCAYDELISAYSNLPGRIIEGLDKTMRFEEGFTFGKSSTDILKHKLGLDNPATLTALHNFGVVLDSKGKYQDAYDTFKVAFVHRLKIYSYENTDTLTTRNYMALELLKLGQYDKAFRIFDEVYKTREVLLGPDDPETLNSRSGKALVLSRLGKYQEAYNEYNEIYDRQVSSSGGKGTQQALTTLNDMAVVLEKQGEYQKAIELYRKICKIREDLLGSDHPSVLINRNNLAYALQRNGEYEESLEIYKDITGRIKDVLGPDHPSALETRNNMAITLGKLGKHREALEEYQKVYDKQVVKLGKTHRSALSTLNNIAYTYEQLGNHDEALRKYNEVIEDSMVELGEDHSDILETKINIASVYFKLEMYDKALEFLQGTYEKFQSRGDTLKSSASICRQKLGETLKKLDRHAEAFQLFSDFYETTKAQHPDSREVSTAWKEMESILNDRNVNDLRRNREGMLHWAVKNNFLDAVKLLLENEVDVDALDGDGKKAVELTDDRNIKRMLTKESCATGSRGGRSKREARNCDLNGEEEKIPIELNEAKDPKFTNWLRGGKYSQLVDLAHAQRTNKFRETVEMLNNNEQVMAHLNRVGIVSGVAMHGMMAKNVVADLLNGNYAGVAVNLGFIAGGQGFYRTARAISMKGGDMVAQGRLLLGRSLQSASPFLARGTSAFVTYDLVNQIRSYRAGDKDALVGVIGDGIYIGVDIVEIGVEVAEVFSVLEGVSPITGPVGAAIGAVVFVGTDVYSAIRRVSVINREIPLSFGEKFVEGLRAFIGLHPGRLIEELLERKDLNNRLLANALQNLKRHPGIRRYVLPIGKIAENCQNVPESKRICIAGGFGGCPRTRIVTRNVEKCKVEFTSEPNSTVLLDIHVDNLSWSRSAPDVPESSEMFCFDKGEQGSTPTRKSYLCENAMGITDVDPNKIDGYTLINLEDGNDTARGFNDSPNLFVVGNGMKRYHGGDSNDTFMLTGDYTLGSLFGGNGVDTLDLTAFAPGEDWVETRFDEGRILLRNNQLAFSGIEKFLGRNYGSDKVYVNCIKYVDGQGGGNERGFEDYIYILDGNCTYNIDVALPSNTLVQNHATSGTFSYSVPYSINGKIEVTTLSAEVDSSFSFQYGITDITSIKLDENNTNFILAENFDVTISGAKNYNYRFKDADIRTDTRGNSYVLGRSNGTVESITTKYSLLAARLGNSSFVVHAVEPNEIIAIGNGNHIMANDPGHTSHLIGNRGENIFVINPVDNSRFEVDIYNFNKERCINTVDLRKLNVTAVKMESCGNDLILTASGLTVKLKNGTDWYDDVHVVLVDNPMKIKLDERGYYLTPQALVFGEGTEIIVITDRDVEENSEIVTPRIGGAITFARNGNQLVLTNVFGGGSENICTIVLSDFYTSSRDKLSTLCITFAERKMCLKDHTEEIDSAKDIEVLKRKYNENNERLRTKRMINDIETSEANENITNNPTDTNNIENPNNDSNYRPPPLTNGATKHSSIITAALNWMKSKTASFLSGIFNVTPLVVDSTTKSHLQHVDPSLFDINGTLLLVDVLLAKKTGRKIYAPCPDMNQSDSLTLALNIWIIFKDSVLKSAEMAGIHHEKFNIDYYVMKDVVKVLQLCIGRGKCNNIVKVLKKFAMKVCPVADNDSFVSHFNQLVDKSVKEIISCGPKDLKENVYKNNQCTFNISNGPNRAYRYYLQ